jgi:nicotinamide phosphoribosyltransferase
MGRRNAWWKAISIYKNNNFKINNMITNIDPMCLIDGYKADHRRQYPEGTEFVYSNGTFRMSRMDGVHEVIFFGLQYFIKEYVIDRWNKGFFERPLDEVLLRYKRRLDNYLGPDAVPIEHVEELHNLGYLPIRIKALPEGTLVPIGVPPFTIVNTKKKFFWLTNYFETLMSNIIWKPCTSAS